MALQDIVKKILNEAEKEANTILNQYQIESDHILAEKKGEFEKREKQSKEKINQEAEEYYKRLIQIADLEMRKERLSVKQQLLMDLFQLVEDRILSLPKTDYLDFMGRKIMDNITTGKEEIIISEKDKERINQDFINKLNVELKEKLKEKGELKLSSEFAPLKGGFILRSGNIQLNCSIESMLKEVQERVESEMVQRLFSGE